MFVDATDVENAKTANVEVDVGNERIETESEGTMTRSQKRAD